MNWKFTGSKERAETRAVMKRDLTFQKFQDSIIPKVRAWNSGILKFEINLIVAGSSIN
jgi:hypothetical protein